MWQRLNTLLLTTALQGALLCFSGVTRDQELSLDLVFRLLRGQLYFLAVLSPDVGAAFFYRHGYLAHTLETEPLSRPRRLELWARETEARPHEPWTLSVLSDGFCLSEAQIKAATELAVMRSRAGGEQELRYQTLFDSVCDLSGFSMGELASPVPCCYRWKDLIVGDQCLAALKEVCGRAVNRTLVYETRALLKKPAYGGGISVLFYGPPGTGKTMAAQVIAREMGCRLYRVDLSQIMDKYVGESEKKLREIFAAASRANVLLFFDEADSLFTKRTGVTGANDRYANAQTAFLLQCMEEYEGLSVLATNLMGNFDEAFKRRIQYFIHFALPTAEQRLRLWRGALSERLLEGTDIDLALLAEQFELSGSSIQSVAAAAVFRAVGRGESFCREYLFQSLRDELAKQGRVVVQSDFVRY